MKLTLHKPFEISARLLPAISVGDGTLSLEHLGGRQWRWYADIPAGEFQGDDLQAGASHNTQRVFADLLCFLATAADSYRYSGWEGEHADLFPQPVVLWAAEQGDDIDDLVLQVEETEGLIEEQR